MEAGDRDLDDAAIWAAVDTAAEASRRAPPPLLSKSPSPAPAPKPADEDHRGEVLQPARPFKAPRLASLATPPPPPSPLPPPFLSPDAARTMVVFGSPSPDAGGCLLGGGGHGLFPSVSVANFKKYQVIALSILEKNDYTLISGNPYIKKSGWRKISCFFNVSYEIKDRSIEFDDDRNVNRAEFLVRASTQGGRFSDGWGSCDRREKRFNKPNHDIPSTAETRAKNKACQDLLGIGNNRPG